MDLEPRRHLPSQLFAQTQAVTVTRNQNPLVIPLRIAQLQPGGIITALPAHALVDSGASNNFISQSFVQRFNLTLTPKAEPLALFVIDGRPIESGPITHFCSIQVYFGDTSRTIHFDVTQIGTYPMVLGIPFLRDLNPSIDWRRGRLSIQLNPRGPATTIDGLSFVPNDFPHADSAEPMDLDIDFIDGPGLLACIGIDDQVGTLFYSGPAATIHAVSDIGPFPEDLPDSQEYIEEIKKIVPQAYHDLLAAFSKQKADSLPPHRPYDLSIDLEEGKTPPFGPIYSLSELELKAYRNG